MRAINVLMLDTNLLCVCRNGRAPRREGCAEDGKDTGHSVANAHRK